MTSDKVDKGLSSLLEILETIYDLLEKEKDALIHNDVDKISEIVEKKVVQIEKLEEHKGIDANNNQEVVNLIKEINSLQEINMLMTRQAMSHQNVLLDNISKNIYNLTNTYSSQGKYESTNNITIIDQSV